MMKLRLPSALSRKVTMGFILIIAGVVVRPIMLLAVLYCFGIVLLEQKRIDVICMLFAWLSISPIFKLGPGTTSLFTYLELLVIGKLLWMDKTIHKVFLASWFAYLTYITVGMGTEYTVYIKTAILPLLLYLFTKHMCYDYIKKVSFQYIAGIIVSSLLGLYKEVIPNLKYFVADYKTVNVSYSYATGFTSEIRFSALWDDPNYFSVHLIIAISICVIFYLRNEIKAYLFYGIYGTMVLFGAMTGSKSFLLMFIILTILLMIGLLRNRQYKQLFILTTLVFGALLLMMLGYIDIFSRVFVRLDRIENGSSDLTTGRVDLWTYYFQEFWNDPFKMFVGNGLKGGFSYRPPHNTYIDFIDILGIFGTAVTIMTIMASYFSVPGNGKGSRVILLVVTVMYFFLSMFYAIDFVFEVALAFSFCKIGPVAKVYCEGRTDEKNSDSL